MVGDINLTFFKCNICNRRFNSRIYSFKVLPRCKLCEYCWHKVYTLQEIGTFYMPKILVDKWGEYSWLT